MSRIVCLLIVLAAAPALGADYLLTVEQIETVTTKEDGHPHVEISRRTVEVLCRPGMPFLGRAIIGPETTTVSGELHETEEGKIRVEIAYSYSMDTEMAVLTWSGKRENIILDQSTHTTVEVEPSVPLVISGVDSQAVNEDPEKVLETSERTAVMTVREHRPEVEGKPAREAVKPEVAFLGRVWGQIVDDI